MTPRRFSGRARWAIGLALLSFIMLAWRSAPAHDIPNQIILHGYVKPQGDRLHFLVRVPLVMLLNLNLPKRGPGFIALDHLDEALPNAAAATAREIVLYEDGVPLTYASAKARISQPSDRSFERYDTARELIAGPALPANTDVFWNQGYFDVAFEYPIRSAQSDFSLDLLVAPGLKNRLKLILRYLPPSGEIRAYELHYGSGPVYLDPRWFQAAWSFVKLGTAHILSGTDHLLFLLCLVAPFRLRQFWRLAAIVTAFTVAHSITLLAAASGIVPTGTWFPPLVETLIAVSIVYMAIENVVGASLRYRWLVTALFGLVHGFGFSFALQQDLQLAGAHSLLSLAAFNVGVEIGQLIFLAAVVPILALMCRTPRAERYVVIVLSVLVGHTAWHWAVERYAELRLKPWPELDASFVFSALALLVLLTLFIGAAWLLTRRLIKKYLSSPESRPGRQFEQTFEAPLTNSLAQLPQAALKATSRSASILRRWGNRG
ncbi:MAG: HupE/UreJ family protein [Gammaproteobacteria bacterium]|nr:HupE/UreJ family protein [Gammaproteobacteria bacterium]MDH3411379.1 HupE/UreJ family protein [Gammaproteobacteria bacterium]